MLVVSPSGESSDCARQKKLNRAAISGSNGDTRTMIGEETETEWSQWSVRGEAKKWRLSAGR